MIIRSYYLEKLLALRNAEYIKIITGIRRCGKSTLLKMLKNHLISQEHIAENRIIEINYEKFQFDELRDGSKLHEYIASKIISNELYYLFIDEIQELPQWPRIINSLRASGNIDIYVTGSNSRVFSGEHLTYISGRYTELKVFPLSFGEFKTFSNIEDNSSAFNDYLRIGSFPALAITDNEAQREAISSGLFDSIFSRDILLRGKIRDEGKFFRIAKFIGDGIGSQMSVNSIMNTLKSQGYKISAETIDNYITLMCKSFLLYSCERYDIRDKDILRTNGKLYMADLGLRNQLMGYKTGNIGHQIENLVYLELLRQGYEVYVGKLDNKEIDFIATQNNTKIYVQVAMTALDENTLIRELDPFYKIKDNYRKILITADAIDLSRDGIEHINLYDFLSTIK